MEASTALTPPSRYFDRDFKVDAVKILPGQYFVSEVGAITTVLGSCVSTCLWDPIRRIGGMNHFMLPDDPDPTPSPWAASARFGVYAMEVLINEMIRKGASRKRLQAKIFGGARVIAGMGTLDVGAKNCQFALEFLQEEGIQIVAQDLLGVSPRKLHFFPATGKVQLKRLHLTTVDVQQRERDYLNRLSDTVAGGDVEIFTPRR